MIALERIQTLDPFSRGESTKDPNLGFFAEWQRSASAVFEKIGVPALNLPHLG
jgi:hypothetical protein